VPTAYAGLFSSAQSKYTRLPDGLLSAVADAESGFNPNAKNKSGASGMMQFMPATAQGYGIDPFNPSQAVDAAGKMLNGLMAKYNDDLSKTLAAYNWGGGNVDKAIKKYGSNWLQYAPTETKNYIKKILGR
jgi:soluble lytic murein transglycosylase-like protein